MLLSKTTLVKWNSRNKLYYENLGYTYTKMNDEFEVNVLHLTDGSKSKIDVLCDYCLKKIFTQEYKTYLNLKDKSPIKKDSCIECKFFKIKDTCIYKYGVSNPMQSEEVKENLKQYFLSKYGVENPYMISEVRERSMKKMCQDGIVPKSKQQIYLNNLLNGEINYPVGPLSLDIAFPKECLYIEYNGGGHYAYGNEVDINKRDIKRYFYLKSLNWKMIKIISKNDLLPQDNVIKVLLQECQNYLNNGFNWIEINIDLNKMVSTKFIIDIDLGNLRSIKSHHN